MASTLLLAHEVLQWLWPGRGAEWSFTYVVIALGSSIIFSYSGWQEPRTLNLLFVPLNSHNFRELVISVPSLWPSSQVRSLRLSTPVLSRNKAFAKVRVGKVQLRLETKGSEIVWGFWGDRLVGFCSLKDWAKSKAQDVKGGSWGVSWVEQWGGKEAECL